MLAGALLLKVAFIPFLDGVKASDTIVVGRVSRVVLVAGHRFADLDVESTLKGSERRRVRFLAEPTWTCDSSSAVVGERGIFLFHRIESGVQWNQQNPGLKEAIDSASRAGSVYQLDHSGSGRIIVPKGLLCDRMHGDTYSINMYMLPKGMRPGKVNGEVGRFEETKFVSAVQAMVHGQTFPGTLVKRRSPLILRQP